MKAIPSLLLVLAVFIAGCPLGRQRHVECGSARSAIGSSDSLLAPFAAIDPATATAEQRTAWATAAGAARDAFHTEGNRHADVTAAMEAYRTALEALRTALTAGADANAVRTAASRAATARNALAATCAVDAGR